MSDQAQSPPPVVPEAGVELLELTTQPVYVLGFPMHITLSLAPVPRAARINELPLPTLFDWADAIGLTLESADDERRLLVRRVARPIADDHLGSPLFRLGPHDPRDVMLDLADVVPASAPAGTYTLSLYYDGDDMRTQERSATFEIREPDQAQSQRWNTLAPELRPAGSWSKWAAALGTSIVDDPRTQPPTHGIAGLQYLQTVRQLKFGPVPPEHFDPALLDPPDPLYAPYAAAWKAELLDALVDPAAPAQVQAVRSNYPGLGWWMTQLETTGGELEFARTMNRPTP
ncbi:MAG: hypothetical protein AAF799_06240 [Myxococcota bacterium]